MLLDLNMAQLPVQSGGPGETVPRHHDKVRHDKVRHDTAPVQEGAVGYHSHRRNRFHVLSHMRLHSLFSLLPASLPQSCAISAICDKATINQKLEIMGNMGG